MLNLAEDVPFHLTYYCSLFSIPIIMISIRIINKECAQLIHADWSAGTCSPVDYLLIQGFFFPPRL